MKKNNAVPKAGSKIKKICKKNDENPKNLFLLTLILYIFFYLIGIIDCFGKIISEKIISYSDKIASFLTFIIIFFVCMAISLFTLKQSLGNNNISSKKVTSLFIILVIILAFIFYKFKIILIIQLFISPIISLLLKLINLSRYFIFFGICYIAGNFIIYFIK